MPPNPNYVARFFHTPALDSVIYQFAPNQPALISAFRIGQDDRSEGEIARSAA
jgi:hypothetical protein